jgi:hypothetical protein
LRDMIDMSVMYERDTHGSEVEVVEDGTAGFPYCGASVFGLALIFIQCSKEIPGK